MDLMNYHYNMLGSVGQECYKRMLEGFKQYKKHISIPMIGNTSNIMEALMNDHPELFYVNSRSWSTSLINGRAMYMDVTYYESRDEVDKILSRARAIAHGLKGDNVKHTMRRVHDYIGHIVVYDKREVQGDHSFTLRENHCMLGPLFEYMSVCEGIARFYEFCLKELGIPCTYMSHYLNGRVPSEASNHAWNIVLDNGNPVKVDATWDLIEGKECKYKYFCVPENYWG